MRTSPMQRPVRRDLVVSVVAAVAATLFLQVQVSPASASPTQQPTADSQVTERSQLLQRAKHLQFGVTLHRFLNVRSHPKRGLDKNFVWKANGCSAPFDAVTQHWQRVFRKQCLRHDFGYRNFGHGLALKSNAAMKARIDSRFHQDMDNRCGHYGGDRGNCYAASDAFYVGVTQFGDAQTAFYAGECPKGRFCLFDDTNYEDRRIALRSSVTDMNDINFGDKTSSAKNRTHVAWIIYDDHDFDDRGLCIRPGYVVSRMSDYDFNDKTSSAKRLSGTSCP